MPGEPPELGVEATRAGAIVDRGPAYPATAQPRVSSDPSRFIDAL